MRVAGVTCYWIIKLLEGRIEVYAEPFGSGDDADYRSRSDYGVPPILCRWSSKDAKSGVYW
jgi:hypothetical protein